ncbi:hypothetical protein [Delftia deserti]|uniref:Uncharacterized protein n=1 Tax=Delftia deserti TaxID=1651218 RepID=A0ABW5EPE6_9BURK
MRNDAKKAGIDLLPFSTFRDFRTQLRIWNGKFSGKNLCMTSKVFLVIRQI